MDLALATYRDLDEQAREHLRPEVYDFIAGGAEDECTLVANVEGFAAYELMPRVLRDVSEVDTSTTVLGTPLAAPVFVAPMGAHELAHSDAELATARGAAATGVGLISSTASTRQLEDEAKSAGEARWFQLYAGRDRAVVRDLVARVEAAGFRALCLTVDAPVLGLRRRDFRNRFRPAVHWVNLDRYESAAPPAVEDGSALLRYFAQNLDPSLTWDFLDWLVAECNLPVVLKGVLSADDARLAVEHGAAGVYVSNHGGRQLDRARSCIAALEEIVAAVDSRVAVMLDGGVRSPSDIAIALALGADAVAIGRPVLFALAIDGEAGVESYLRGLVEGFARTLRLLGVPAVSGLTRDLVFPGRR